MKYKSIFISFVLAIAFGSTSLLLPKSNVGDTFAFIGGLSMIILLRSLVRYRIGFSEYLHNKALTIPYIKDVIRISEIDLFRKKK